MNRRVGDSRRGLAMPSTADLAPFTVDTCNNSTSTKKADYQSEHFNFVEIP